MTITWDAAAAAHLLRRAGLGAPPAEVDRAVRDGLEYTVDRLLDYESVPTKPLDDRLAAAGLDLETAQGIFQWWIIRLRYTDRPLEERMTLIWHDHWATAISKVREASLMLGQNRLLRQHATGNFAAMARAISRDPAMLIWLDNFSSRKEHPNENYGREFLELFALGHGNYTEEDVIAAARAFTGFSLARTNPPSYQYRPQYHDDGTKTFLGQTGAWNGDDIVRITCETEAHGFWIAHRLFEELAYADPDHHSVLHPLAETYLDSGTEIKPLLRAILLSPEMYSAKARWQRVKSPVEHLILSARIASIEITSRAALGSLQTQGHILFNPPDVDGWPTRMEWINSGSLLSRMNLADTLSQTFDPAAFQAGKSFATAAAMVDYYLAAFALDLAPTVRGALISYLSADGNVPPANQYNLRSRGLLHLILSLAEWQMN
jgi:uncharacterized protein (DUF1800 family)